ncbi:unnamed protein product, partial [Linum tenue]
MVRSFNLKTRLLVVSLKYFTDLDFRKYGCICPLIVLLYESSYLRIKVVKKLEASQRSPPLLAIINTNENKVFT